MPLDQAKADFVRSISGVPGALENFFALQGAASAGDRARVPTPTATTVVTATARNKYAFAPTAEQTRVHVALCHPDYVGESPSAFAMRLTSSRTISFDQHPGIATRLYDFAFGKKGFSIMHFATVGMMGRLEAAASPTINMNDFSASMMPPKAKVASSWGVLHAATSNFASYCRQYCDGQTYAVATVLIAFVESMEDWQCWPEEQVPLLVTWINDKMDEYRFLVDADAREGTNLRSDAIDWFKSTNLELNNLLHLVSKREIAELKAAKAGHRPVDGDAKHKKKKPPGRDAVDARSAARSVPADVIAAIPKRDGKELCLTFASKRGCTGKGDGRCSYKDRAHFVPKELPAVVAAFIVSKFGGLAAKTDGAQ